jgi:hypothetical protein
MCGGEALWQQDFERLSVDFCRRVAEHFFGSLIKEDDQLPGIDGNNRVIGEVENSGERIFAIKERGSQGPIGRLLIAFWALSQMSAPVQTLSH